MTQYFAMVNDQRNYKHSIVLDMAMKLEWCEIRIFQFLFLVSFT